MQRVAQSHCRGKSAASLSTDEIGEAKVGLLLSERRDLNAPLESNLESASTRAFSEQTLFFFRAKGENTLKREPLHQLYTAALLSRFEGATVLSLLTDVHFTGADQAG